MTGLATWSHTLGFVLFGGTALLMGALRNRGTWPLVRRTAAAPRSLVEPIFGPPSIWHAGVLQGIDALTFQALCGAMFQQDGGHTGLLATAGNDFVLQHDAPPLRRLVRCHAGSALRGGEPALRAFAGAIAAAPADSGLFIAAGQIDAEAIAFARRQSITLVDGAALLKLIAQRSPRQQRALRAITTPPAEARPSRFALAPTPAPAWFAMAAASLLAAWVSWPAPGDTASAQAEATEPARLAATSQSSHRSGADPDRPRAPRTSPATTADLDPPPVTATAPAAGRQILRCTDAGRVTYLSADASCASGRGERVTVFPTEGVNPFR